MRHYITDKHGIRHTIEECGWEGEKAYLLLDGYKSITRKMGYRHERTWDDHMGNTPCGYYVDVPVTKNESKRIYLTFR